MNKVKFTLVATFLAMFVILLPSVSIAQTTITIPAIRDCVNCPNPSTNGTGIVSFYGGPGCTGPATINGSMTQGVAVSGVTMTLYANVTQIGTWNIQAVNNGVTFTGTGTFTATGCQPITLTATGTPIAAGPFTWNTNTTPIGSGTLTVGTSSGTISFLNCNKGTTTGTLIQSATTSGVSFSVPYTAGDGGSYTTESVNSTGMTGLTATRTAGFLVNGNGSVTYTITGTPSSFGVANFAISLGGQSCTYQAIVRTILVSACNPNVNVVSFSFCSTVPGATLNDNPATSIGVEYDWTGGSVMAGNNSTRALIEIGGQCWMARDLNTLCTTGICSTTSSGSRFYNWTAAMGGATNERSQGVCPTGWHIPSECEFAQLTLAAGASPTEINSLFTGTSSNPYYISSVEGDFIGTSNPVGWGASYLGWQTTAGGSLINTGIYDDYWTSTTNSSVTSQARAFTTDSSVGTGGWSAWPWPKQAGYQVRCLRD